MTHNALETLWGSGDPERDANRKATARSMISPSVGGVEREQEIYTPPRVLAVVAEIWPEGIACDPCSGPDSLVEAALKADGVDLDGLLIEWPDRTYENPPYKDLKEWLAKTVREALSDRRPEILVLCPVRTHRVWFRAIEKLADRVAYLDPLTFVGFRQAFPAPLCLIYFGRRIDAFDRAARALSKGHGS